MAADHAPLLDLTFPAEVGAVFDDGYDAQRSAGHVHRAIDLFAPLGSPVFAAVAGVVTWRPERHPSAGYAIHIRGSDGRTYAYYHLGPDEGPPQHAYADGVAEGAEVARGQLIGFVGDSGNAAGGRPHVHFEIHDERVTDPYGTNRINAYPSLVAAVQRGDYSLRVLRLGARGGDVAEWQRQLNRARPTPVAADGVYGPQTEQATREFQSSQAITVDGVVGTETRGVMRAFLGAPLQLGDQGAAVAAWQRQLNRTRVNAIAVDGVFGPQTDRATRAFQRERGLTVDGIVGPQTRDAMRATPH